MIYNVLHSVLENGMVYNLCFNFECVGISNSLRIASVITEL